MRPVFLFPRATIVDCGASRTALAVFSQSRAGRLRLERHAVEPLAGEAGSGAGWLERTAAALKILCARAEPAGPVTVVLPPHLTLMKMLSTPRVEAAKRDKIISFESQQSIPYPLTDVVWDRVIADESGQGFNVLLCAAKLDALDPLCAALVAAGLTPSVLLPSALAVAASYRELRPEPAGPALLVNLGARSTTLVLLEPGKLQARSLALGGTGVATQTALEPAGEPLPGGELKPNGQDREEITPAVRQFAGRLAQEISRTLGYFGRSATAETPLRLMLTGGNSRLPGLAGLLTAQLNVPVVSFDPVGMIDFGREAGDFSRERTGPVLADLIGGAALRFRAGQPPLNLLPPRLREQAGRRRLRPWLAAAAALAVAAVVPAVAHYRQVLATAHAQNVALERELAPLRAGAARSQENRRRAADARRQLDAWRKVEEARTGWLRLLGDLQARFIRTGDVWLERMKVLPAPAENEPARPAAGAPLRLAFSGLLRPGAATKTREEAYQRVRGLLESLAEVPQIAAVESERLEPESSGLLSFEFVVLLKPSSVP